MLNFLRGDGEGPNLLAGTFKVALALAALGYLAAHSFSSDRLDHKGLSRLAVDVARKLPDPGVTGSVMQSAKAARLDPCAAEVLSPGAPCPSGIRLGEKIARRLNKSEHDRG